MYAWVTCRFRLSWFLLIDSMYRNFALWHLPSFHQFCKRPVFESFQRHYLFQSINRNIHDIVVSTFIPCIEHFPIFLKVQMPRPITLKGRSLRFFRDSIPMHLKTSFEFQKCIGENLISLYIIWGEDFRYFNINLKCTMAIQNHLGNYFHYFKYLFEHT